jgi:poly(hydroxyalkanoate) depolymerase family esterase
MNDRMNRGMIEATRLTRAGQLADATALLQRLLRGETPSHAGVEPNGGAHAPSARRVPITIDMVAEAVEAPGSAASPRGARAFGAGPRRWSAAAAEPTARPHLPEALAGFLERVDRIGGRAATGGLAARAPQILPDGASFRADSYADPAGSRAYKLFVPSGYQGQALPLVVMLHGCTQSPDDFAAGTRMNELAEEQTCLVVYPAQAASANASKCWNWFSPRDQQRGRGEPALIAGITRQVMRDHAVDPRRVYVAGLSAGAAAAAIMGMTYPDLYAAVGVHSGLACGAASDVLSAFAAMRQGKAAATAGAGETPPRRIVPTIVFHGDQDTTVNPCNADQVIAQVKAAAALQTRVEQGQVPGGRAYSRTLHADASGRTVIEQWVVHGGGHAWSGGSPAGSYTDPQGPDASREMLRFFLQSA